MKGTGEPTACAVARRAGAILALLLVLPWPIPGAAQSDPREALREARRLTSQQSYEEALALVREVLATDPTNVEARLFLGVIHTRRGDLEQAVEVFNALAEDHPELPEPLNNLAVLHAAQGRYEESRQVLLRAIDLEPRYDTAHENLGDVYAKLASLAYDRAWEINRDNSRARGKARLLDGLVDKREVPGAVETEAVESESVERGSAEAETRALGTADVPPQGEPLAPASQSSTSEPSTPELSTPELSTSESPAPASPAPEPLSQLPEGESTIGATTPPAPDGDCLAVGGAESEAALEGIVDWLAARGIVARAMPRTTERIRNYQVFLPPLESREAALGQIDRLKAQGIQDILIISNGELTNGITLGVYTTESAVERRVAQLRALGLEPEQRPRSEPAREWWVDLRDAEVDASALEQTFPEQRVITGCMRHGA